ncbi:MAG: RNA 2',3'-cyclic phosphodiesterase [Bacillota bacterium]
MRLFIAIPLPPDVRRELSAAQQRLMGVCPEGRFVPSENFHITLHFIGESADMAGAALACDEAVRGIRPFVLRLSDYGSFARGRARTGYIGLSGDMDELYRLHETLTAALRARVRLRAKAADAAHHAGAGADARLQCARDGGPHHRVGRGVYGQPACTV